MLRKKKLFFIINSFSMGGGAEALLTQIVNNLDSNKYEIGIMEIIHSDKKQEKTNKSVKIYPYFTLADAPDRKQRMYYVYHEWDMVIKEYIPDDYDIYISFNYLKPTFLLPKGKKCIAWIHGDVYNLLDKEKEEERKLQSEAFKKADKIITISDITTQSVIDVFPEHKDKVNVLYNGIDIDRVVEESEQNTNVKLKHPSVLSIGRLDNNKNPIRMFDIFRMLHEEMPEVHLYYLGYGELSEKIECLKDKYKLQEYVHLLGYHDNPFPIIKQCNVVGMFSKSEGFPMALLEAVALGKPFVSSLFGGARILANEYNCGKVIKNDDEAVEAFKDFLLEDTNILKDKCNKTIVNYEFKRYINRIESILDSL